MLNNIASFPDCLRHTSGDHTGYICWTISAPRHVWFRGVYHIECPACLSKSLYVENDGLATLYSRYRADGTAYVVDAGVRERICPDPKRPDFRLPLRELRNLAAISTDRNAVQVSIVSGREALPFEAVFSGVDDFPGLKQLFLAAGGFQAEGPT